MIKDGKGGANTQTGLHFEAKVDLKEVLKEFPGYSIEGDNLLFKGEIVAIFYKKHDLYKRLLKPAKINYKNIISKKLLPDNALFVLKNKTIFIIEIKFQRVAGSVDEKIQTCDFKNKQYNRLLEPLGVKVKYLYVLNDWFKDNKYDDVKIYIKSMNCQYYFNGELKLEDLGLPSNS